LVIVPDNQLSLAIGKEGQNARLAAKLTGWRIDIKSESQIKEQEAKKIFADLPPEEEAPAAADGQGAPGPESVPVAAAPSGEEAPEGAPRVEEKSVAE
jgi:transcription termination/antitermination protein NusA